MSKDNRTQEQITISLLRGRLEECKSIIRKKIKEEKELKDKYEKLQADYYANSKEEEDRQLKLF